MIIDCQIANHAGPQPLMPLRFFTHLHVLAYTRHLTRLPQTSNLRPEKSSRLLQTKTDLSSPTKGTKNGPKMSAKEIENTSFPLGFCA
jgi:hypothetical protein